jgi:hypothetical protein
MGLSEETELLLSQLADQELPVDRANQVLVDVLDNPEARDRLKAMLRLRRLLASKRRQKPITVDHAPTVT